MSQNIASDNNTAVLGLGLTGRSAVRYLHARGHRVAVFDSGLSQRAAAEFQREYPQVPLDTAPFDGATLSHYSQLLVSPGISLEQSAVRFALDAGSRLISDIDLLKRETAAPIIAITGANGKTTVTTLLGLMAEADGRDTAVGGNIGTPVLDLLAVERRYDVIVLELSSFQLERCAELGAEVATVLNLSPDHMDRYVDLPHYQQVKQAVYRGCRHAVYNREDKLTWPLMHVGQASSSFGMDRPDLGQFGLIVDGGECYLARGNQRLLACSAMKLRGRHNQANALAALALGQAFGLGMPNMLRALSEFAGLPHRCQWVGEVGGVEFFNDSKGTNVGATLAAVEGLSRGANDVVLIAGGVGKGADFTALAQLLPALRALVVLGEAAAEIASVFGDRLPCVRSDSMAAALQAAVDLAQAGDMVLLSPACASFDMYRNYQARGEHFASLVAKLTGAGA